MGRVSKARARRRNRCQYRLDPSRTPIRAAPSRPWNPQCVRGRILHARGVHIVQWGTFLPGVVATDLATEHGGTDANERDEARQVGTTERR
jgi:hypothetical protein